MVWILLLCTIVAVVRRQQQHAEPIWSHRSFECRLGVLVEVNCETDFVAKGDIFRSMAQDMAMQIAANAEVEFVAKEDASPAWLEAEKQSELQKEDLQSKPENIR